MKYLIILSLVCILVILFFYFVILKRRKRELKKEAFIKEAIDESFFLKLNEFDWKLKEEYQFTIYGLTENSQRNGRNRQLLLLDMNNYDEVWLELDDKKNKNRVLILNKLNYDLGYLSEEDEEIIIPYLQNKEKYRIESGVEKFIRSQNHEGLIIYVTVFEYC